MDHRQRGWNRSRPSPPTRTSSWWGCCAWSDAKVGVDAGELAGIDPLGITATNDVELLLGLEPDCVVYNPMWPSTDELVRILAAGVDVVTTAAFINGPARRRP